MAVVLARREDGARGLGPWTLLLAHAALLLPMAMTNAHENHLYLGTVFFVLLLPRATRLEAAALHVLMALQALNLVGIYGLGEPSTSALVAWIQRHRTPALTAALGLLTAVLLVPALGLLYRLARGGGEQRLALRQAVAVVGALAVLAAATVWRMGAPLLARP
jgi:hypothetical protein